MHRSTKIKVAVARTPLRKAAAPISAVVTSMPRRAFPAWIDASERSVASPAISVTPRVRDGLVLRVVAKTKPAHARNLSHGSGAR
jgi:hypothetical protein